MGVGVSMCIQRLRHVLFSNRVVVINNPSASRRRHAVWEKKDSSEQRRASYYYARYEGHYNENVCCARFDRLPAEYACVGELLLGDSAVSIITVHNGELPCAISMYV